MVHSLCIDGMSNPSSHACMLPRSPAPCSVHVLHPPQGWLSLWRLPCFSPLHSALHAPQIHQKLLDLLLPLLLTSATQCWRTGEEWDSMQAVLIVLIAAVAVRCESAAAL